MATCVRCGREFQRNWVMWDTCRYCRDGSDITINNTKALQAQYMADFNQLEGTMDEMAGRFYVGSIALNSDPCKVNGLQTFATIEEAVAHATPMVNKEKTARYIVTVVAKVECSEPPVKVTVFNPDGSITVKEG